MRQLKKSVTRINNGLVRCLPRLSDEVITFTVSSLFVGSIGVLVFKSDGIGVKRQSRKRKALPSMSRANDAQMNDKVERVTMFFSIKI